MDIVWYVVIIIIMFMLITNREALSARPDAEEKEQIIRDVLTNRYFFRSGKLNDAKKKFPWVDPVIFEDIRRLRQVTRETLNEIL